MRPSPSETEFAVLRSFFEHEIEHLGAQLQLALIDGEPQVVEDIRLKLAKVEKQREEIVRASQP